jgi:AbrB family looped-hinge helix DNA binding protein
VSRIVADVILDDRVKLNENGRIVIPAAMRDALQIKPGDELLLHLEDGELHVTTRMQRIRRAQELVRQHLGPNPDLVDGFIAERREAAKHE